MPTKWGNEYLRSFTLDILWKSIFHDLLFTDIAILIFVKLHFFSWLFLWKNKEKDAPADMEFFLF